MKTKGQMELSSTVIVTIIISVVIVGIGFILLFKIVNQGNNLKDQVLHETDAKLQEVLNTDKKMFVVNSNQAGSPGKKVFLGVGVVNRAVPQDTYSLKVTSVQYVAEGESPVEKRGDFSFNTITDVVLKKNEGTTRIIETTMPSNTQKGTYIFTIYACASAGEIDNDHCPGKFKYAAEQAYITT